MKNKYCEKKIEIKMTGNGKVGQINKVSETKPNKRIKCQSKCLMPPFS